MFPQWFLHILITLSLVWTGLGAIVLIALLLRDLKNKQLW